VEAVSREHANRRLEQLAAPVNPPLGQGASIIAPYRWSVGGQAVGPIADGEDAVRSVLRFEYGYPAAMVGGLAVLATRSPSLGFVFAAATWTLAYVFVRREPPAPD
jgi:hypothetical protein